MLCSNLACAERWIETHVALAAWVQAIGTLVAIAFSLFVAYASARDQRVEARSRRDQFITMIVSICASVAEDLFESPWSVDGEIYVADDAYNAGPKAALDRLSETPLVAWPSPHLYQLVVEFMLAADRALDRAMDIIALVDAVGGDWLADSEVARQQMGLTNSNPETALYWVQLRAAIKLDLLVEHCISLAPSTQAKWRFGPGTTVATQLTKQWDPIRNEWFRARMRAFEVKARPPRKASTLSGRAGKEKGGAPRKTR